MFVLGQFLSASALDLDLTKADWRWASVALATQVLFFLLYGGLYRYAFRAVGVTSGSLHLVPVLLASIFVKTVLPLTAARPPRSSSTTPQRGASPVRERRWGSSSC